MTTSSIRIELLGFDPAPSVAPAFSGGLSVTTRFVRSKIQEGSADGEFDCIRAVKTQVAASGSATFDFRTDTDRYGIALAGASMRAGFIANTNSSGAAEGTIEVEPNAVNGWDSLFQAGSVLRLPYESGIAFWCMRDGGWVIDNTHKVLDITEITGTDPADVEVQFWIAR